MILAGVIIVDAALVTLEAGHVKDVEGKMLKIGGHCGHRIMNIY